MNNVIVYSEMPYLLTVPLAVSSSGSSASPGADFYPSNPYSGYSGYPGTNPPYPYSNSAGVTSK